MPFAAIYGRVPQSTLGNIIAHGKKIPTNETTGIFFFFRNKIPWAFLPAGNERRAGQALETSRYFCSETMGRGKEGSKEGAKGGRKEVRKYGRKYGSKLKEVLVSK